MRWTLKKLVVTCRSIVQRVESELGEVLADAVGMWDPVLREGVPKRRDVHQCFYLSRLLARI